MLSKLPRAVAPVACRSLATFGLSSSSFRAVHKTNRRGVGIVHDPLSNKGTGFPLHERDRLRIRGLVPPRHLELEVQVEKVMSVIRSKPSKLEQGLEWQALQDRNETLAMAALIQNIEELCEVVYTPTVGQICQRFGNVFRRTRGMYFSSQDRGVMSSMVYNWPNEVDVVVITDGSRILGLGDLGCNGMGIPIGKLALYVAAGGINPRRVLPVMLDAGTDNDELLTNPYYLGMQHPRLKGEEYFSLVDECLKAIHNRWPNTLIQFEDFNTQKASKLLDRYRSHILCFNDDIQGTGATALAGVLSAIKAQGAGLSLKEQRVVVAGAGSAGMGVAAALHAAMVDEGCTPEEASAQFWVMTDKGLMGHDEAEVSAAQAPFQRLDHPSGMPLSGVIDMVKPTVLLGLTGVAGVFDEASIRSMASSCDRPIIFPLSNPTDRAECTAEQAYEWTDGRCIFASGSPFKPVALPAGDVRTPSQCNNMFVFPGVGLAASLVKARSVTDQMFIVAARALAESLTDEEREAGMVFPSVSRIREVSARVAVAVGREAAESGLARHIPTGGITLDYVRSEMYNPIYRPLISVKDY